MVAILSSALGMLLDIDRVRSERRGDRMVMYFTTTCLRGGIGKKLSEIKMKLFTLLDVPVGWDWKIEEKEMIKSNPVFSQWNIAISVPAEGITGKGEEMKLLKRLRRR